MDTHDYIAHRRAEHAVRRAAEKKGIRGDALGDTKTMRLDDELLAIEILLATPKHLRRGVDRFAHECARSLVAKARGGA